MVGGLWRNWSRIALWLGMCNDPTTGKTVWQLLKKLNVNLTNDLSIPLLTIHPRGAKSYVHTKTCRNRSRGALFIIAKTWEQPQCPPTGKRRKSMWRLHTLGHYLTIKRNKLLLQVVTQMKVKDVLQKPTYWIIAFVWNIQKRQLCRNWRSMIPCAEVGVGSYCRWTWEKFFQWWKCSTSKLR